ncbi:hypothetical protein [Nocardioides sp. R-C-SC26]|uniref:hypothetical protein n=1 Tax=Nocardioides sp. R-C-SC26 TaxID=2870414 RepID=UPI001E5F9E65|nr:hypothetical protein [Nocardioides sp. R-C-SC26]
MRSAAFGTALLLAVPTAAVVAVAPAAHAALTAPADGAVLSGNITITESGASNPCVLGQGSPYSRIEVRRVSDNALVLNSGNIGGTGSKSVTFASNGMPRGQYRINSWIRNSVKSGFGGLGCTNQGEVAQAPRTFTVDNKAAVAVTLPAKVITGENLAISVKTTAQGNGINGSTVANQPVTVSVPEVGDIELVTDASGVASTTVDLPDLPAGTFEVTATPGTTDLYSTGSAGSATTTLTKRSTQLLYRGDSRAEPGETATLEAVLVDVTPNSDRFGLPVAEKPIALAFGDNSAEVATDEMGAAARQVAIAAPSRVVPVTATFAADPVWLGSGDSISFFVGDDAVKRPPTQTGPTGGLLGGLGGLLGQIVSSVTNPLFSLPVLSTVTDTLGAQTLLSTLAGNTGVLLGNTGTAVDGVLGTLLDGVAATTPLGPVLDTARFEWRAIYVQPNGTRRARTFHSGFAVPQAMDVTGDGKTDVIAELTLGRSDGGGVVPRIRVTRTDSASVDLPLSIQAVIDIPGSNDVYRLGYDTRESNAPRSFIGDVAIGTSGISLEISTKGREAIDVTGAISGTTAAPKEQRFAIGYSAAPNSSRVGVSLNGGQNIALSMDSRRPTVVDLSMVDDRNAAEVFTADGTIDAVDGKLQLAVNGSETGGMTAELTSAKGLSKIDLRARTLNNGRTADDIRLALTDVPSSVKFGLDAEGQGALTASAPIGIFEAGYASGREIAQLDDPAYLRLLQNGENQSVAVRLPGFEGMTLEAGDNIGIGLTMAPTPLRALVDQDGLTFDAKINDAPRQLNLGLGADGSLKVEGSDPIGEVTVVGHADEGIFDGATDLDLRIVDIPTKLEVGVTDDGIRFDTGGQSLGLLEIFADDGNRLAVPGGGDGMLVRQSPNGIAIAGRVTGLRTIEAALSSSPEVLLDTVAGQVFTINVSEVDENGAVLSDVNATLDHLVPNMRLGLTDDGSGATKLVYSADAPTNSLSFSMGGLSGSIANPLPANLDICMAQDSACLPDSGIENPTLGSIRFAASEQTTLNMVDPSSGINVENLQLTALDLTGSVDADNGGPLYLNTATEGCTVANAATCARAIGTGQIVANIDDTRLTFRPGAGFYAIDALTVLKPRKLFGQVVGMDGESGTGVMNCVGNTALDVRISNIPIIGTLTVSLKDAICNVNRTN